MTPGRTRRDRHGRGMRGQLAPLGVPITRSTAKRFDDLVLDAVEHLEDRWGEQLTGVEFAVEEVPPEAAETAAMYDDEPVPLGRVLPSTGKEPARVVLYRRPLELRAHDPGTLADLVHDVVVEQVARLLGLDPDVVDPPATS